MSSLLLRPIPVNAATDPGSGSDQARIAPIACRASRWVLGLTPTSRAATSVSRPPAWFFRRLRSAAGGEDHFGHLDHCDDLAALGQPGISDAATVIEATRRTPLASSSTGLVTPQVVEHGRGPQRTL
ncbi:MAG TPA: hypothetical protein DHU96_30600 [Actinobacteria bacterium]|nr:hypothetical protein [Actinomycetota bacterium]